MATEEEVEQESSVWETESGLLDDFDGIICNSHFGLKEEYAQAVQLTSQDGAKGLMILFDLADDEGNILAQQGWSIGTGWTVSDDGFTISHPKRENVVTSTLYGQLQNKTIRELGVPMDKYGIPTDARSWDGLKFHWMLTGHSTVAGVEKQGLMPTIFFGKVEETNEGEAKPASAPAPKKAAKATSTKATASADSPGLTAAKKLVNLFDDITEFQKAAVNNKDIAGDDALMAAVLDESESGFFALEKK